jgi:hypothetical protein
MDKAIIARPKSYEQGREDKINGQRFSPPDFRADAAAAVAYRAGYNSVAVSENNSEK